MSLRRVLVVWVGAAVLAAACNDTAIVLDVSSNQKTGTFDALCVELDAGNTARFGRRYPVTATENALPQSLTALAGGMPSLQAIVYGYKRGLVVARSRQQVTFKSGSVLHVPVSLDRCQPHPTTAQFDQAQSPFFADAAVLVPSHLSSPGDLVLAGFGGKVSEYTAATKLAVPGNATPALPLAPSVQTLAMIIGDVDGDCRPEVIVVTDAGAPVILRDGGDGIFTSLGTIGSATTRALAAGDVDGDGNLDVVTLEATAAHVWLGNGAGEFHEAAGAVDAQPSDATAVALADLDGDGNLDVVVGQGSAMPAVARVYLNDKTGHAHFTFVDGALPPQPQRVSAIAAADLDGDGTIDLAMSTLAGPMRVYLNRGDAYLDDRSFSLLPDQTSADVPSLLLQDVNDDCLPDLLVPRPGAAPLLWLSQGGGLLASGPALGGGAATGAVSDDVNGDGMADLVLFGGDAGLALELQR